MLFHAVPCCSCFAFLFFLLFGAKFYDASADPEVQLLVLLCPTHSNS